MLGEMVREREEERGEEGGGGGGGGWWRREGGSVAAETREGSPAVAPVPCSLQTGAVMDHSAEETKPKVIVFLDILLEKIGQKDRLV